MSCWKPLSIESRPVTGWLPVPWGRTTPCNSSSHYYRFRIYPTPLAQFSPCCLGLHSTVRSPYIIAVSFWFHPGLALFTAVLQTFFGFLASFINGKSSLLCSSTPRFSYLRSFIFPVRHFWKSCGSGCNCYMVVGWCIVSILLFRRSPFQVCSIIKTRFRYNNKPLSTHPLTRSLAHFTSFSVLGLVWFGKILPCE